MAKPVLTLSDSEISNAGSSLKSRGGISAQPKSIDSTDSFSSGSSSLETSTNASSHDSPFEFEALMPKQQNRDLVVFEGTYPPFKFPAPKRPAIQAPIRPPRLRPVYYSQQDPVDLSSGLEKFKAQARKSSAHHTFDGWRPASKAVTQAQKSIETDLAMADAVAIRKAELKKAERRLFFDEP